MHYGRLYIDINNFHGDIHWEDTQKDVKPSIPSTGVPFIILGSQVKDCHHGPQKKKSEKSVTVSILCGVGLIFLYFPWNFYMCSNFCSFVLKPQQTKPWSMDFLHINYGGDRKNGLFKLLLESQNKCVVKLFSLKFLSVKCFGEILSYFFRLHQNI